MSVIVKTTRPVENRLDASHGPRHRRVPQFELTAPLRPPVVIQVHEYVDSAVEAEVRVLVEVGVNVEVAAGHDLVQAAAAVVRVGDQWLVDSGE